MSLGRISMWAELLDFAIHDAFFSFLPGDDSRSSEVHRFAAGSVLLSDRTLEQKIRLVRELSRITLDDRKFKRICKLLQRADDARQIRNKRVHAIWTLVSEESAKIAQRSSTPEEVQTFGPVRKGELKTADELHREANQVESAARDFAKFLRDLDMTILSGSDESE